MNKKTLIALLVVVVAGSAAGVWWRGQTGTSSGTSSGASSGASPASAGRAPVQAVSVTTVQRRDVPVTLEAAGTVVSLNTVDLRTQVASTVRSVAIREGQTVKQGDLLFTLDDRADRANVEKARAQLMRDRATLADLNRQWTRAQDLLAQNFIAPSAADALRTQVDAQQALVRADEAALQAAEVALGYSSLRSPLAGRAGAIAVYPGSQVQPGGAALVTISQMDPIGVSFTLPEAQLAALPRPGAKPGATPVALSVGLPSAQRSGPGAAPGQWLQGQLSFIDNAVDTGTGTIRLKGSLPNAQQQLWPGQYVVVRMTLRTIQDASVLPQAALIQRGADRSVYVVGADNIVQSVKVQLRYPFGEYAVVEGLKGDERVVVEGKQNLRPGATVRVVTTPPPANAAGSVGAAGAVGAASATGAASGASR